MGKIKVLTPGVIAKIAAGEVVERPASVVKELVENALDAGSTEIKVEVQSGGRKLIRVTDNGEGMTPEDAVLAVQRHTTSKIENEKDLWAIGTFGFRGEALSAMAAVSKMRVVTSKGGILEGVEVEVEGGVTKGVKEIGCPPGTSVEVQDLFYNIPARLKFLKSQGTELGHIGEIMAKLALANERTHFQLFHEGKLLANYPLRENPSPRLAEALGREADDKMYFFQSRNEDVEVAGYTGEPDLHRPNARGIHLFVNRRPVRDRLLTHAVMEAYRNLIPKDRYPVTVLFVQLPPAAVDVNVHPGKWEVKFADSEMVHRRVFLTLREMLDKTPWLKKEDKASLRGVRETAGAYFRPPDETLPHSFLPREASHPQTGPHFFLGQIDKTYLLFASLDGLTIVDQHAAHERILFERLTEEISQGSIRQQTLLFPEIIELPFHEARTAAEHLLDLEKLGFEVIPAGERSFWVKSVPEILTTREPLQALQDLIGHISSWGKDAGLPRSFDPLFQMMACRGAVQASELMTPEEAATLLTNLQNCVSSSHCPHGRPTMQKITLAELEKMFGRK